jgi:molecular chaperone DnaK (HSP70)
VSRILGGLRQDTYSIDEDLDPEEAVLKGTAVIAKVLYGDEGRSDITFLDMTISSLGLVLYYTHLYPEKSY